MPLLSPQVSTKELVPLCRSLATSYDAGIPILKGLEMAAEQARRGRLRGVLRAMHDELRRGASLGDAARMQSKYLPSFLIQLLSTGEQGGKLDVMLRDLADYYEDRLAMRRRILGSMVYPMFQLALCWFLGTFAIRLVTQISAMFGRRAPAFSLESYFSQYIQFQVKALTVFAVVVVCCIALARLGIFGWISGAVTTHVWPLSPITRKLALARFFRSMSLLMGSGMHVVPCIESSAAVTSNPYIQRDLLKAVGPVREGATLVAAFENSRYITPLAREMIYVGEQSGNLEGTLNKVSQIHLDEASNAIQAAVRVLNVVIVLAVGLVIGYVIITFYSRLYGGLLDGLGV